MEDLVCHIKKLGLYSLVIKGEILENIKQQYGII